MRHSLIHFILFTLAAAGCGSITGENSRRDQPASTEAKRPNYETRFVSPIEAYKRRYRGVVQFISANGKNYAVEKSLLRDSKDRPDAVVMELIQLDDAFHPHRVLPITVGRSISNVVEQQGTLWFAGASAIREKDGSLWYEHSLNELPLDGSEPFKRLQSTRTLFDGPVFDFKQLPSEEALRNRREMGEIWNDFLNPDPVMGPMLVESSSGLKLVFNHRAEVGEYDYSSGKFRSIKPLNIQDLNGTIQVCRSQGTPVYVSTTHRHGVNPFYPVAVEMSETPKLFIQGDSMISLDLPSVEGTYQVNSCLSTGAALFIAGAISRSQDWGGFSSTVWIAKIEQGRFVGWREVFLPKKAFASAINMDSSSGEVVVGGSFNYEQAPSGSHTDMDGFVLSLNAELELKRSHYLKGPRSTRVYSLAFAQGRAGSHILVGGFTDAPSTHDPDRVTKSFVEAIAR